MPLDALRIQRVGPDCARNLPASLSSRCAASARSASAIADGCELLRLDEAAPHVVLLEHRDVRAGDELPGLHGEDERALQRGELAVTNASSAGRSAAGPGRRRARSRSE